MVFERGESRRTLDMGWVLDLVVSEFKCEGT